MPVFFSQVKRGGIPLFMWRMDLENYWKVRKSSPAARRIS